MPLAPLTTIGLGGPASYYVDAVTEDDLAAALSFAREHRTPVRILGGGSNVIFADHGFRGMVIRMASSGIERVRGSSEPLFTVRAGHPWDDFVAWTVAQSWAGVECLSGIPGSAGGVPVQNVGAYGQEASDTLVSVRAFDRTAGVFVEIPKAECAFGYRKSRFKHSDAGKFVITEITFRLAEEAAAPRYPELIRALEDGSGQQTGVAAIREAVLGLRKKKSMVYSPADPDSKSCGSFFTNPVLSAAEYQELLLRFKESGINPPQVYADGARVKVPAAFLIEKAGFAKGTSRNGAGISARHALALVNRGCTALSLMELAHLIEGAVREKFGITLEMEPEYIAV